MKIVTKEESIASLKENFSKSSAVIFADYKGVTSEEMNALRRGLREKKVLVKVAKNNLVRIALKGTPKEQAVEKLAGPTVTLFALGDAVEAAKSITEFAKKVEAFSIKEGFLGDQVMNETQIKQLATLPSKPQLVAQLLSVMNGPIRNFVGVLNAAHWRPVDGTDAEAVHVATAAALAEIRAGGGEKRLTGRDPHDRAAECVREPLGGREPDAEAGEGARARPDDDPPERRERDPGRGERPLDPAEQLLPVAVTGRPALGGEEPSPGIADRGDGGRGRGVEREERAADGESTAVLATVAAHASTTAR